DVTYQTFDEIYPPGTGRDVAVRTCVYCHGQDFLPNKHMDSRQWNEALDYMTGKNDRQGAMIQPNELTDQNRKDLLEYLVKNFGPNSPAASRCKWICRWRNPRSLRRNILSITSPTIPQARASTIRNTRPQALPVEDGWAMIRRSIPTATFG